MRWGLRASSRQQPREAQPPQRDQEQQDSKGKKSKAVFSSFSPLAWLSKLTTKNNGPVAAKSEQATPASSSAKSTAQPASSFPPNFHKPASTSPAPASQSSPSAGSSSPSAAAAAQAGVAAPRRRSVGNDDNTEPDAAAPLHVYRRRRHYSVGGDRDLLPLGHLISFSPKPPPTPAPVRTLTPTPPLPPLLSESESHTDEEDEKRPPRSQRRRHRPRRAGRRSFSSHGKHQQAPGGVRVRSPRVSELERFAVVRRTRDPQREFRASMVAMIASKRMVGRPEELETLLACYLSLNADEHHDCIVKVFRQVWFDLNNNNNNSARAQAQVAATVPTPRGKLP
ncbi:hypothetical protein PR202_ga09656 [Eleusine coracana subsp. coracana]|uniref:Transcription repressor n=1 Tax=Eleusine coracana subsp. coracana TaxID=191504 RepID=A0AAV5C4D3_ELECO|nr:hypothetical protein QOZ80_1AG0033280 [Eleusine coracana subsp. coracana]GJM93127.1 hypothetical protein PR202_ga09656 [Eleusine coracana subsp. coracana]